MIEVLKNVYVVLVRPQVPQNIGAAARVVANMGLGGLRVVEPHSLEERPMYALAVTKGRPVLEAMGVFEDLGPALADCSHAVATTARQGSWRGELLMPRQAAGRLLGWAGEGRLGLVFGPEDRGLENRDLDHCQMSICIPTDEAASLNLAQAVMVLAYELRVSALDLERPITGIQDPKPAPVGDRQRLYGHLREAMVAANHLPSDNPEHFFRVLRAPLERAKLTKREVRAWHGLARQVLWMAGKKEEGEDDL